MPCVRPRVPKHVVRHRAIGLTLSCPPGCMYHEFRGCSSCSELDDRFEKMELGEQKAVEREKPKFDFALVAASVLGGELNNFGGEAELSNRSGVPAAETFAGEVETGVLLPGESCLLGPFSLLCFTAETVDAREV